MIIVLSPEYSQLPKATVHQFKFSVVFQLYRETITVPFSLDLHTVEKGS